MLEELRRRRDSPTADIEIRLRPGYDVDKLKKYFVGNTTIYPDFNVIDTAGKIRQGLFMTAISLLSLTGIYSGKNLLRKTYSSNEEIFIIKEDL